MRSQETQGTGQFCWNLPDCVLDGSPKINYVAAYQYNGEMPGWIRSFVCFVFSFAQRFMSWNGV